MKKQSKISRRKRSVSKKKFAKERKKNLIVLLIVSSILLGFLSFSTIKRKLTNELFIAKELIAQGNCNEAIPKLNEIILASPRYAEAYYERYRCYAGTSTNNYDDQYKNFVEAIKDLDTVISLRPKDGDNYVDREYTLRQFAEILNDSASKFAIYELAVQDSETAMQLGVSMGKRYVYRHHARNLIESNQCQEGLDETLTLITQTNPQDSIMDTYNIYLTEAYLCLGDLEKALENAQKVQCDDPVGLCRSGLLATIYLQMGENEKALTLLDNMIAQQSYTGGWRYFMRALAQSNEGRQDEALKDITLGEPYTWVRNGVYWYVKAKIAQDEGDDENHILYLQYAESTLDIRYTPLRKQIQKELATLGIEPLVIEPAIPPDFIHTP
ncbi:MAG: hypothetical protein GY755_20810 [Chloroflexi bacterium]|nr:hypothetical protein [Chloroflexota bacterium]